MEVNSTFLEAVDQGNQEAVEHWLRSKDAKMILNQVDPQTGFTGSR